MPTRHEPALYLIVSFCALLSAICRADDWLYCDLTINNAPVHFIFDSGATSSWIFRPTAERLGIKIIAAAPVALPPGKEHADSTEPVILGSEDGASAKISMTVVDTPPRMPKGIDGVITLDLIQPRKGDFLLIDMAKHVVSSISVPTDIERWSKWKMIPDTFVPMFEGGDGEKIGIATGAPGGVYLSPTRWEAWRARHDAQSASINGYFAMDGKLHVSEDIRARKLTFGDFTLNDVPVCVLDAPATAQSFKGFDAIIGNYALYQMKVIIDQQHNTIYTRPIDDNFPIYDYNRLGAIFIPNDPVKSDDLKAHVVTNSPAYKAGIRDNDVLEKIDDLDVTKWKTNPSVLPLNRFWIKPAGTSLHLFLRRDTRPYDVQVILEDLTPVN